MCIGTLIFIFILNRKACLVIYNFLSKDFAFGEHTPRLSSLKSGCTLTIRNFSPVLISYCQCSLKVLVVHSDKHLFCSQVYGTALIQTVGLYSAWAVPLVFIVEPKLKGKQLSRGSLSHDKGRSTIGQNPCASTSSPCLYNIYKHLLAKASPIVKPQIKEQFKYILQS